jgi:hypothetical protein
MRAMALGALMLMGACAEQPERGCEVSVTRPVAFTAPDAEDVVTTRSFGASCEQTIGVYTVATGDGHPVWAHAIPLARAFGDGFAEPEREAMRAFLERWAQPEVANTSGAPAWAQLVPGQTTLDRLTYEDIRARALPMLCHYSGTARQICVFWEPGAASAGHFFDRDATERNEVQ